MRLLMSLGLLAMLGGGCDSAKEELETTRATLTTVTKERDDLRAQVATLQKQVDTAKADAEKAKAAPPAKPESTALASKASKHAKAQ